MSHPDEGLIHAWLDGELDATEAARIEALVRDDPAWGAAAAEARGLVAASARIIGALDHVPANVVPKTAGAARPAAVAAAGGRNATSTSAPTRRLPWWTMRAAAVLVVATGSVVVFSRTSPNETGATPADVPPISSELRTTAGPATPPTSATRPPGTTIQAAPTTGAAQANAPAKAPSVAPELKDAAGGAGGAGGAGSARAEVGKLSSADERRVAVAEKTAVEREDLKKESSASGASAVAAQRAQTVNAISREECYREPATPAGAAPVVHRVGRIGDSTAIAGGLPGLRRDADALRARQSFDQVSNSTASTMRVRGDTLFVQVANGTTRVALRITCPAP